jgi:hypothetical protein
VTAILLAAVCTAWLEPARVKPSWVAACAAAGAVIGALVGVAVGLSHVRRVRATAVGLMAGPIAGSAAGATLAVPYSLPALAVGSLILVLFCTIVRFYSTKHY